MSSTGTSIERFAAYTVTSYGRALKALDHLLWRVHEGRMNGAAIAVAGVSLCRTCAAYTQQRDGVPTILLCPLQ